MTTFHAKDLSELAIPWMILAAVVFCLVAEGHIALATVISVFAVGLLLAVIGLVFMLLLSAKEKY